MTEPTKENKNEDKDNQENNYIEDKDNLKDIEKDTKKDTDNSDWGNRLDVLKKRKEELRDDGTPGRKLRLSLLDWRIEKKSPKQIKSGNSKKNNISKIEEKEEKKIEKINNPKTEELKPEVPSQEDKSVKEKSQPTEINKSKDDEPKLDSQEPNHDTKKDQNDLKILEEQDYSFQS